MNMSQGAAWIPELLLPATKQMQAEKRTTKAIAFNTAGVVSINVDYKSHHSQC